MSARHVMFCLRVNVALLGVGLLFEAGQHDQQAILMQRVFTGWYGSVLIVAWAVTLAMTAWGRDKTCKPWVAGFAAGTCALNAALSAFAPVLDLLDWQTALWRAPLWMLASLAVLELGGGRRVS